MATVALVSVMVGDPAVSGVTQGPVMMPRLFAALDAALGETAGATMVAACTTSKREMMSADFGGALPGSGITLSLSTALGGESVRGALASMRSRTTPSVAFG